MEEKIFISLTKSELEGIITTACKRALSDFNNQIQEPTKYLKTEEASKYIGKSPNALRQIVYRGEIPSIKRGNNIYFLKRDLDNWMCSGIRNVFENEQDPVPHLKTLRKRKANRGK